MKPATANRVRIYRVEGNVPISHREKSRAAQNEPKRTVSEHNCMYCVCMYVCMYVCNVIIMQ